MSDDLREMLRNTIDGETMRGHAFAYANSEETLFCEAFGSLSTAGTPMRTDSVCIIASMTKAVTGAAAMQLVEQGRLQLDMPAGDVCPYLRDVQVFEGYDENADAILRPPRTPVTLRHLLTHTSGFVYDLWNPAFGELVEKLGLPSFTTRQKRALEVPLMFDPDERWEYGIGIDWVGQMVEAVSGTTLGEYVAANITGPLQMHSTAFTPDEDMLARLAETSQRQEDGTLRTIPPDENPLAAEAPEFEMGGGGLLSTTVDYLRFLRAILRGGELDGARILQAETVALMCQNSIGALDVVELPSAAPALSNHAELFPGAVKKWGLTFQITEAACATGRAPGTLMWAGLTNCYYWIDREKDLTGVYVNQIYPFADERCLEAYYQAETLAYSARS
ncbi:MAG: serine hydrolase domain-containing protein [Pseudomonadota bacterium]